MVFIIVPVPRIIAQAAGWFLARARHGGGAFGGGGMAAAALLPHTLRFAAGVPVGPSHALYGACHFSFAGPATALLRAFCAHFALFILHVHAYTLPTALALFHFCNCAPPFTRHLPPTAFVLPLPPYLFAHFTHPTPLPLPTTPVPIYPAPTYTPPHTPRAVYLLLFPPFAASTTTLYLPTLPHALLPTAWFCLYPPVLVFAHLYCHAHLCPTLPHARAPFARRARAHAPHAPCLFLCARTRTHARIYLTAVRVCRTFSHTRWFPHTFAPAFARCAHTPRAPLPQPGSGSVRLPRLAPTPAFAHRTRFAAPPRPFRFARLYTRALPAPALYRTPRFGVLPRSFTAFTTARACRAFAHRRFAGAPRTLYPGCGMVHAARRVPRAPARFCRRARAAAFGAPRVHARLCRLPHYRRAQFPGYRLPTPVCCWLLSWFQVLVGSVIVPFCCWIVINC